MNDIVEVEREFLQHIVTVLESKEFNNAFRIAHIHNCPYTGPIIDMPRLKALAGEPHKETNNGTPISETP